MYWKILIKLLKNTEYNIYGTRKIPQSKYKKISNIIDDIIDDIVIDNIKDKRELKKKSNKKEELYYTKLYFLLSYNIIYQDYNIIINEDHVLDVLKYNNMIQLLLVSQVNDLFTNIISVIQNKNLIICRKQCLNKIKNLNYYFARKTNDSFRILTIGLMGFGTCITCKGIKQINNIIKKNWNDLTLIALGCGEPQPLSTAWKLCSYIKSSYFVDLGDDKGRYYNERDFLPDKYPGKFCKEDSSEFIKKYKIIFYLIISISWPECPVSDDKSYDTLNEHISYWSIKAFNSICELAKTTKYDIWLLFTGRDECSQEPNGIIFLKILRIGK